MYQSKAMVTQQQIGLLMYQQSNGDPAADWSADVPVKSNGDPAADWSADNLGKSMSSQDFVTNLEGMNDGKDFPKDFLKALYHSIKSKKLEWAVNDEELQKSIMPMSEDTINIMGTSDKGNPFLEVLHDHKAPTYKQGFLSRKFHADIDGKKTPWGKRSWKTFYVVLKGTIIYLLKVNSQNLP
ncbi:PH and SEC7 domain-containing protein 2-like [Rhinoraja longicauda]